MPAPRFTTYALRVWMGDPENPTEHHIVTLGRDVQRTEMMFAENGWGKTENRPITSAAAVAYFAMMRLGLYSGTWKDFSDSYLSIEPEEPINSFPIDPGQSPG